MKKLLLIPLLLFCVTAFGQWTKPQLYTNINTNIRLKTYSPTRMAALLDSLVDTMGTGSVSGSGTTNQLTYWTSSSAIGTLTTATYPSLTELSYVKGLTSSAQTQLGTKWGLSGTSTLTGNVTIQGAYDVQYGGFLNELANFNVDVSGGAVDLDADGVSFRLSGLGAGLTLGSDATGDIFYRNSGGYLTRLPVGSNGDVLTIATGLPSWAAPSGGLTVGTSTITSGTNTRVLYNNSGTLGEYTISGSGNVAMTSAPTITDAKIRQDVRTETGTTYTIQASDEGLDIYFTNASDITVTLPNGLSDNFICFVYKKGTGNVILSATTTLEAVATTIYVEDAGASVKHIGSNVWQADGALGEPIVPGDITGDINHNGDAKTLQITRPLASITSATTAAREIIDVTELADGDAIMIEVTYSGKDDSSNTGFGGTFTASWTKASSTLNLVGQSGTTPTYNDTGGSFTISTSDSSGSIDFNVSESGVSGNFSMSMVAKITLFKA